MTLPASSCSTDTVCGTIGDMPISANYDPNWRSASLSGWCASNLHGYADDQPKEPGYCQLDSVKCGCKCHNGAEVIRHAAWFGPAEIDYEEDEDQ